MDQSSWNEAMRMIYTIHPSRLRSEIKTALLRSFLNKRLVRSPEQTNTDPEKSHLPLVTCILKGKGSNYKRSRRLSRRQRHVGGLGRFLSSKTVQTPFLGKMSNAKSIQFGPLVLGYLLATDPMDPHFDLSPIFSDNLTYLPQYLSLAPRSPVTDMFGCLWPDVTFSPSEFL